MRRYGFFRRLSWLTYRTEFPESALLFIPRPQLSHSCKSRILATASYSHVSPHPKQYLYSTQLIVVVGGITYFLRATQPYTPYDIFQYDEPSTERVISNKLLPLNAARVYHDSLALVPIVPKINHLWVRVGGLAVYIFHLDEYIS